jgi:hypothetical protein
LVTQYKLKNYLAVIGIAITVTTGAILLLIWAMTPPNNLFCINAENDQPLPNLPAVLIGNYNIVALLQQYVG